MLSLRQTNQRQWKLTSSQMYGYYFFPRGYTRRFILLSFKYTALVCKDCLVCYSNSQVTLQTIGSTANCLIVQINANSKDNLICITCASFSKEILKQIQGFTFSTCFNFLMQDLPTSTSYPDNNYLNSTITCYHFCLLSFLKEIVL